MYPNKKCGSSGDLSPGYTSFKQEVRPLNESVTAFFRNDYYVDCLYNKDRNTIMFHAFYCPERYSELDYDENESVLSQIENYCYEIGIRFSPNDELMEFIFSGLIFCLICYNKLNLEV